MGNEVLGQVDSRFRGNDNLRPGTSDKADGSGRYGCSLWRAEGFLLYSRGPPGYKKVPHGGRSGCEVARTPARQERSIQARIG